MDPFSITVGILGIINAVDLGLKLSKKYAGPSTKSSTELQHLTRTLCELYGVLTTFNRYLELQDDDRLPKSYEYLKLALERCDDAVGVVTGFLQNAKPTEKAFRGVKFDKKFKVALKTLDDACKVFKMATMVDQQ